MLPLILHEAAVEEIGEAIAWYESKNMASEPLYVKASKMPSPKFSAILFPIRSSKAPQ